MERNAIATIGPSLASGPILPAALLHSLRRMAAAGHRPTRYIVLRLTDGRVKAFATAGGAADPMSRLGQLRNEFGPLSKAFLVGSEPRQEGLLMFVEDLLTGGRREDFYSDLPPPCGGTPKAASIFDAVPRRCRLASALPGGPMSASREAFVFDMAPYGRQDEGRHFIARPVETFVASA